MTAGPPPAALPKKIVLGVTGCIGAYKAPDLVRALRKRGFRVQVILTRAAREFVSPLALATVSGEPVLDRLFGDASDGNEGVEGGVRHISLTEETDLFLVAPATAHAIARLALGLADDFLTTFHLALRSPTLVAPAMNTNMLEHPATRAHLDILRSRGAAVIEPGKGELACGWTGPGCLPDIPDLVAAVGAVLEGASAPPELVGRRVLIAAGPTREPLDPVRYFSNRSSGRMGLELARAALDRGAAVTLVLGPTHLEPPAAAEVVRVESAVEMRDAVRAAAARADAVVMAAAVTDFRPEASSPTKQKSADLRRGAGGPPGIRLVPNPDILAELGGARSRNPEPRPAVLIGFAAETEDPEAEAIRKLGNKRCDLIVGNRVGPGRVFGEDRTEAVLVERRSGGPPIVTRRAPESKRRLAGAIWAAAARRLAAGGGAPDREPARRTAPGLSGESAGTPAPAA